MKIKNTTGAPLLLCVISALLIGLRFVDLSAFYIDEKEATALNKITIIRAYSNNKMLIIV